MNILFINGSYPCYGGTEKVTTILANQFVQDDFQVHIASFRQVNEELLTELDNRVTFHRLSMPVFSYHNIIAIHRIIKDSNIDIIMNQWCLPFLTTLLINFARKGTNCKLVSVLHGVPDKCKKVIILADKIEKSTGVIMQICRKMLLYCLNTIVKVSICLTYYNSDRYVVLSIGFIKSFKDYTKLKNVPKLKSIGNPLTIKTDFCFDYVQSKKKQLLYVGRMDFENKRVNRIIEAWGNIHSNFEEWNLVLVGDGPHKRKLETYVDDNKIPRVTFTGFVKGEPIAFYKDSSIFILTSDLEGFGLVITESMSYGVVPVVYGSYVSVYDIIDNGVNGYIIPPPYSSYNMEQKLKDLMTNELRRKRMAYHAIEKSKKYSIASVENSWEKLFKEVLSE